VRQEIVGSAKMIVGYCHRMRLLLAVALAVPQIAYSHDAGDWGRMARGTPAEDHYAMRISIKRTTHYEKEVLSPDFKSNEKMEMTLGPFRTALKLVPPPPKVSGVTGGRYDLASYIMRRDVEWKKLDEDKKYKIAKLDGMSDTYRKRYAALAERMPELESRLRAVDEHAEDAAVMLRLLQGVVRYSHSNNKYEFEGRALPVSGPVSARSSGTEWKIEGWHLRKGSTIVDEKRWSGRAVAEAWEIVDIMEQRRRGYRATPVTRVLVWRFKPEEMARVRKLLDDLDAVKKELYREDIITPGRDKDNLTSEQRNDIALTTHAFWNGIFWLPFEKGLHTIVSTAWMMSPQRPPAGLFADDGAINPDAKLVLPSISNSALVRIEFDEKSMFVGSGREKGEGTMTTQTTERDLVSGEVRSRQSQRKWRPDTGGRPMTGAVREPIEALDGSEAQWTRRLPLHPKAKPGDSTTIAVTADVPDERFGGSFRTGFTEEKELSGEKSKTRESRSDRIIVMWEMEHNGEPVESGQERLKLRFVQWTEGGYQPLQQPVGYGVPFYVEGRLEEDASKDLYAITISAPGGEEHKAFLVPTEEDRRLLRSDQLYLMWKMVEDESMQP